MGISDIYLIAPAESKNALEAALSQNPHLTGLPLPRPNLLAPAALTITSGTGDIFRQPEVREVISGDFIVLPCDLVSELSGLTLLQAWMVLQASLGGVTGGKDEDTGIARPLTTSGEKLGRRGGLGVWYETKTEDGIKNEQTDFIATVPCPQPVIAASPLSGDIAQLVYSLPTDSLNDKVEESKGFRVRHSLLKKFRNVKMRTTMRDAHVYIFPFWALEFMQNGHFESIGEDVLGWWAKSTWQDGLSTKLYLDRTLQFPTGTARELQTGSQTMEQIENEVNVADYISTRTKTPQKLSLASRTHTSIQLPSSTKIPPMLAYIQPSNPSVPFIRRVDTTAALLSVSLRLARLPEINTLPLGSIASPLAHPLKIAASSSVPQQTRVEVATCLVAENVTIAAKCNIKDSVIGSGCTIGEGSRLIRCLLMEDVVIGDNVSLSGCVIGRRCKIEGGPRTSEDKTDLRDCEVQGGYMVSWGTDAKSEKLMISNFESPEDGDGDLQDPVSPFKDDGLSHR
jgi:translation initiation factor eIF-2B subunit gamma